MPDRPKTGRRVQIYLPADLLERWDQIQRYERSATVAAALREYWGLPPISKVIGNVLPTEVEKRHELPD